MNKHHLYIFLAMMIQPLFIGGIVAGILVNKIPLFILYSCGFIVSQVFIFVEFAIERKGETQ